MRLVDRRHKSAYVEELSTQSITRGLMVVGAVELAMMIMRMGCSSGFCMGMMFP